MTNNPLIYPREIRKMILKHVKVTPKIQFNGKGFICALINSRCHIGCSHCMFASNMDEKKNDKNTMTPKRIDKLMKLVKDSNTGYLLISGGGEGFLEPSLMYQIVEKTSADLTWMVTSGFWGKDESKAIKILNNLYKAYLDGSRYNEKRRICIRISFDSYHIDKLSKSNSNPLDYIINIIRIFESTYSHQNDFFLQLHSIEGEDKLVEQLQEKLLGIKIKTISSIHKNEKSTESAISLRLPSGYIFDITFAKLLLSDTTVDLNNKNLLEKRIKLWERDTFINEKNLPSCKINKNGLIGTNMLVLYNGRVAGAWQSEMPDISINLDTDDYIKIMDKTLFDVGVLATIEKGSLYRFNIINEVSNKASIRAKAVNIRDFTSPILFEEDSIKTYYSIRVIQDFLDTKQVDKKDIENYPIELKKLINMNKEELQYLYHKSNYDIIKQFEETEKGFSVFLEEIRIFLTTKDSKQFISNLEKLESSLYIFDKWRILLKRISLQWYVVTSLRTKELDILEEVEQLIDSKILKGRRIYDELLGKI